VYVRLVGSTTLTMLSFTAAFGAFDPKAGQPLPIDWAPPPNAADVQLRALTTRQHLYYRMDTRVRAGETQYRWPTDVLAAMGLGRADIGLVGSTRQMAGGAEQEVLLPLSASPENPPRFRTGAGPYTLLVQSAAQLSELFVTITRLADGGAERTVQPARAPRPAHPACVLSPLLGPVHRVTRARTVPAITHIKPGAVSPTRHTQLLSGRGIAARQAGNAAICTTNCSADADRIIPARSNSSGICMRRLSTGIYVARRFQTTEDARRDHGIPGARADRTVVGRTAM